MTRIQRFAAAVVVLAGCSGGPDSDYSDATGAITYRLRPGGKLEITANVLGMVQTVETEYRYEEGKVKIGPSGGPQQVISFDKDGCLQVGFPAGRLCKK